MNHLPALPIVIPLACAALMLLLERHGMTAQRILAWTGIAAIALSVLLLLGPANAGEITVYLLGNWPAHLGIALVVDRLTVLMLTATTLLALCALLYASSGSDRSAPHFHALFQLQLAGINGAFLTGDLFNLFVFFEMLLIASYGLLLSGGKGLRLRAGLHYVAFNITASLLFLVALGFLYGLTGTLNMAEMAYRVAQMPPADAGLIRAAGLLLLVVFCSKAALLPLYFWLPQTYARAPAAVAALFAIMTKVGVYAVLRVFTLVFGSEAGVASNLAIAWLLPAAAITLALSALGALAARSLRTQAAYLIIGSAATIFIAIGLNNAHAISAGLYYLSHSVMVGAALFLIADLVGQHRVNAGDNLLLLGNMTHTGLIGALFVLAAMSVVGFPPLSGFIGKLSLLASMNSAQASWLWPVILLSSLLVLLALARAGSHVFWRRPEQEQAEPVESPPALAGLELAGTGILLALGIILAVAAAPVLRFTDAAAMQLVNPAQYREAVRSAQPLPPATGIRP